MPAKAEILFNPFATAMLNEEGKESFLTPEVLPEGNRKMVREEFIPH